MDRFSKYVKEMFEWNEEMRDFLESEKVGEESELWGKLNGFTEMMEGLGHPLSDLDLLNLQTKADTIQQEMEEYFKRKQVIGDIWMMGTSLPAGGHTLPDLPYPYQALEPYISEEIMKIHHDVHHRAYVDGLNKAELSIKKAREENDFSLINYWTRELAFHGSGHYLHTIFWKNMIPQGTVGPHGSLITEINSYFSSFELFQKHFSEVANRIQGNGWALLVWSPRSRHLEILQAENHHFFTQWDTIPILVLDVWEHAYYLQYKNNRKQYIENWWKLINWNDVELRFEKASELKWQEF
ncbi:MAG: superoxide dismutase [Bacillota bacterium]|nr:superoxide dismutase [Bacillota bacterium]